MTLATPTPIATTLVFGYVYDNGVAVKGATVTFVSPPFLVNDNLITINEEVVTDSEGRYQATLPQTVDTGTIVTVQIEYQDSSGKDISERKSIIVNTTSPSSVQAQLADATSDLVVVTQGPQGPAGPAGPQGPAGPSGASPKLAVADIDNPVPELSIVSGAAGGDVQVVYEEGDDFTWYIWDTVTAAVDNPPYVISAPGGKWVAIAGKYNNGTYSTTGSINGRNISADGSKLDGIEIGAQVNRTAAQLKIDYESNADTNAFTDAEQTKLIGIEDAATADQTGAEIKSLYEAEPDTNAFTDAEQTKLTGIEDNATADQTGAEIKALYEVEPNAYTDVKDTKLAGIEDNATADQTDLEIKLAYEANLNTNAFTDTEKSKLAGVEPGATGDQTAGEIKVAYESNADTNAFTDAEQTKLAGIETGATANVLSDANPQDVGTTSSGVSTDTSRADHVHAHGDQGGGTQHALVVSGGAAGFMSGTDKAALDALVGGQTPNFVFHFGMSNISAGTVPGTLGNVSGDGGAAMLRGGEVYGITIKTNATRTAGTITASIILNGVVQNGVGEEVVIDATFPDSNINVLATPISYNAGDILSAQTAETVNFSPNGADAVVCVYIRDV